MYDIIIVGSGPAGANLARLIGERYKVLLIDKRDLENANANNQSDKACGGLLAPDAQKIIAKLGLGIPKDILVDPQLFAVRTIDITNNLENLYQRFYFNIDRGKFDRWLVSSVPACVDRIYNAVFKNYAEIPGGYEVSYLCNGQEHFVKTRLLIGADGAFSRVRQLSCRCRPVPEKYIAIQEWYECPDSIPYFTAIFDEEISNFYSWIIPKNNVLLFGSALKPGVDCRNKFERLKLKLLERGFALHNRIKTEGGFISRPRRLSQLYAGHDGIVLVGEAAAAISPSSAEGISYALKSSMYLAQCLEAGIDGYLDRYKKKLKEIRLNLLVKNLKSPAMYNPLLRKLVMTTGLLSIK